MESTASLYVQKVNNYNLWLVVVSKKTNKLLKCQT
jgi:hypothetical protein